MASICPICLIGYQSIFESVALLLPLILILAFLDLTLLTPCHNNSVLHHSIYPTTTEFHCHTSYMSNLFPLLFMLYLESSTPSRSFNLAQYNTFSAQNQQ